MRLSISYHEDPTTSVIDGTTLISFLQRHLDELPAEERHTMLADAYGETLRLAELVEELLLLARADASADKVLAAHISFFNQFGNSQRIINRMYRQWQPL